MFEENDCEIKRKQQPNWVRFDYVLKTSLREATIVCEIAIAFVLNLIEGVGEVCGGVETAAAHGFVLQAYEGRRMCESNALWIPSFHNTIIQLKTDLHYSHCVPLSKNKCPKIDLRSLKWVFGAPVYRWNHFIHFWRQFTNMQNGLPHSTTREFHLFHNLVGGRFSCL